MAREKISFADYAWLRMDYPTNLMVITGLMTFDKPLSYDRLIDTIENYLLRFTRFRQRLVPSRPPSLRPYWEDDPNFNLESHVERIKLPKPADQEALQDLIGEMMSKGLPSSRPLWQFYLVENYGEGNALIARLHHCIADGISLMQVLLSLTDTTPEPRAGASQAETQSDRKAYSGTMKTSKSAVLDSDKLDAGNLWKEGLRILSDPTHARYRARQAADMASDVGKLVLRWPDPQTIFKGPLGIEKRAAWSKPLDLSAVKFIGKTLYGTVNDVLLTIVAGALGRYADSRGETVENIVISGLIPVNLRPLELDEDLGNKFGLVFLSLPIGVKDPIHRLLRVKHNMDEIKSSTEPVATFGIINLLGAIPEQVEDLAIKFFDTKGSTVITNVPGPQTQLYLAGAPIESIMAWVPQSGRLALGISVISYNGKVWVGVATDKRLMSDPEAIIEFADLEFQEMLSKAQEVRAERRKLLQPILSRLDEAIQTLDELLDDTGED